MAQRSVFGKPGGAQHLRKPRHRNESSHRHPAPARIEPARAVAPAAKALLPRQQRHNLPSSQASQ